MVTLRLAGIKEPYLIRIHYVRVPVAQTIIMNSKSDKSIKILKFYSFLERDYRDILVNVTDLKKLGLKVYSEKGS
jgi:hypothetical protein